MIWKLLTIIILYSISFLLSEFFYKKGLQSEYSRKIAHIFGGLISLILPLWFDVRTAISIAIFFSLILFVAKGKKLLNSVNNTSGHKSGAILFPLGLAISFATFVPISAIIFQGSVLVLALSDGLAGLLGYKFGTKKYNISGNKTYLGSFLFFIVTLVILLSLFYFVYSVITIKIVLFSILGSLLLTIIEGLLGKGLDNLIIPVSSGFVIYYLLFFL